MQRAHSAVLERKRLLQHIFSDLTPHGKSQQPGTSGDLPFDALVDAIAAAPSQPAAAVRRSKSHCLVAEAVCALCGLKYAASSDANEAQLLWKEHTLSRGHQSHVKRWLGSTSHPAVAAATTATPTAIHSASLHSTSSVEPGPAAPLTVTSHPRGRLPSASSPSSAGGIGNKNGGGQLPVPPSIERSMYVFPTEDEDDGGRCEEALGASPTVAAHLLFASANADESRSPGGLPNESMECDNQHTRHLDDDRRCVAAAASCSDAAVQCTTPDVSDVAAVDAGVQTAATTEDERPVAGNRHPTPARPHRSEAEVHNERLALEAFINRRNGRWLLKCFLRWHRSWFIAVVTRMAMPPQPPTSGYRQQKAVEGIGTNQPRDDARVLGKDTGPNLFEVERRPEVGHPVEGVAPSVVIQRDDAVYDHRSRRRRHHASGRATTTLRGSHHSAAREDDTDSVEDLLALLSPETRHRAARALGRSPPRIAPAAAARRSDVVDASTTTGHRRRSVVPARTAAASQRARPTVASPTESTVATEERRMRHLIKRLVWGDMRRWRKHGAWDAYGAAAQVALDALESLTTLQRMQRL